MTDRLPQTLLDLAAEVEADEARLKQQILDAARARDCDRVIEIVEKWLVRPPAQSSARVSPCSHKHLSRTPCLPRPLALESSPPGPEARLEAC